MTARSKTAAKRTMVAFRCDVDRREQIGKRAAQYRMTLTDYLISAALGQLPEDVDETNRRLDDLDKRLERLESSAY